MRQFYFLSNKDLHPLELKEWVLFFRAILFKSQVV